MMPLRLPHLRLPKRRTRLTILVLLFFVVLGISASFLYHANDGQGYSSTEIQETMEKWLMTL